MEVLPDVLVKKCFLGVPYTSHDNLKAVCRSWQVMMSSPHFYVDRKTSGTSEHLICFIQHNQTAVGDKLAVITIYDHLNGTCKRLNTPIDDPHFLGISIRSQCVAVNKKLVLITRVVPSSMTMKSVYIYDFESARWSRGADMPTPRSFFACSAASSDGLVYVAGGIDETYNPLAAAESYNVEEDRWEILPPMIQPHGKRCHGVFIEGKFMVLSQARFDRSGEIFNPRERTWTRWEGIWSFDGDGDVWSSCAASYSSGDLYVFSGEHVIKYDPVNNLWTPVASFPERIDFFTSATQWRDSIFVITCNFISGKIICYLFNPSTTRLIEVNRNGGDSEGFVGVILSATTVEI